MSTLVKALILAAGRGSRMGSLTEENPKCMLQFRGKPLIETQIQSLKAAGISDIGIICGYKAELLFPYSSSIFINPEWHSTNMVFSLLEAKEWLLKYECIVSYSDIFYSPEIIEDLKCTDEEAVISYDSDWLDLWSHRFTNPLNDAETFKIDENGYLKEIGEKPTKVEDIEGQYMGLLRFKPSFWERVFPYIKDLNNNISMTEFINIFLKKGVRFKAIKNKGAWGEIDSPSDLKLYEKIDFDYISQGYNYNCSKFL